MIDFRKYVSSSIFYFFWGIFVESIHHLKFKLFYFNESLYEPLRRWLGWEFTGGPKFVCLLGLASLLSFLHCCRVLEACGLFRFFFFWKLFRDVRVLDGASFFVIRFVLNFLKVHHNTLRYLRMYRLLLFEDLIK